MMMTKINEVYRIYFTMKAGSISLYTGYILEEDDSFIRFYDKFGFEKTIRKTLITQIEEITGEQKDEIINRLNANKLI